MSQVPEVVGSGDRRFRYRSRFQIYNNSELVDIQSEYLDIINNGIEWEYVPLFL